MADKKISELNSASLPLVGTEVIPIVQGGETKKITADDLKSDRLSNDIADYTTATLPLSDTDKLLVNQGGTFKEVAKSELGGGGKRTWILAFSGGVYYDTTSAANWAGMAVNATNSLGLNGHTSGLLFITNAGTTGLPMVLSSARVIPYNCKIKSFHIRNASSPYSAVNPANFKLRFHTHTPNGTSTLNNPVLQAEFNSTGFNMPQNYVYPSSCFTNNDLTLQAGDVITVIHKKEQTLTAGTVVHDFYLEFEEI